MRGSSPTVDAEMLYLSRPISSCRKPISAVQNPAETQQNSTANSRRMPLCKIYGSSCMKETQISWPIMSAGLINAQPWYGRMVFMYQVATTVCASVSSSRM